MFSLAVLVFMFTPDVYLVSLSVQGNPELLLVCDVLSRCIDIMCLLPVFSSFP